MAGGGKGFESAGPFSFYMGILIYFPADFSLQVRGSPGPPCLGWMAHDAGSQLALPGCGLLH